MPVQNCYYDTPWLGNGPSPVYLSPVICGLLVVCIISGLLITGFFPLDRAAETSSSDVDVVVQLSGNDVLVTVLDGEPAQHITGLHTYIDGYTVASSQEMMVRDPPIGEQIVYPELAKGVIGHEFVIVEATFADGTTSIVDYSRMQFS